MINQDKTSWDELGPRLEDIFKQRAEKVAFVKGDDAVEFAQVARAIDIMRGSGIEKVGLITAKVEAGNSSFPGEHLNAGLSISRSPDAAIVKEILGCTASPTSGILLAVVIAALVSGAGCDKLGPRQAEQRRPGLKGGQFDLAVEDFKQAKDLDPNLTNARLYLATAYANQYIPGAPSDDNIRMGQQAISEFKQVLDRDPNNLSAIDGIGSIVYNMGGTPFDPKKFEESKTYHQRHIAIKPQDPEPYYWIGVIDWSLAYRGNKDMRERIQRRARNKSRIPTRCRRLSPPSSRPIWRHH